MFLPIKARTLFSAISSGSWCRIRYTACPASEEFLVEPISLLPNADGSYTSLLAKRVNAEGTDTAEISEVFEFQKIEAVTAIEPPPLKRRCGVLFFGPSSTPTGARKERA